MSVPTIMGPLLFKSVLRGRFSDALGSPKRSHFHCQFSTKVGIDRQINTISSEEQDGWELPLLLLWGGRTQGSWLNATLQVAQKLQSYASEPLRSRRCFFVFVPTSFITFNFLMLGKEFQHKFPHNCHNYRTTNILSRTFCFRVTQLCWEIIQIEDANSPVDSWGYHWWSSCLCSIQDTAF